MTTTTGETETGRSSTSNSRDAFQPATQFGEKGDSNGDIVANSDEASEEYPHGVRLFMLVGSVMCTVFLIALDQVSGSVCTLNKFL